MGVLLIANLGVALSCWTVWSVFRQPGWGLFGRIVGCVQSSVGASVVAVRVARYGVGFELPVHQGRFGGFVTCPGRVGATGRRSAGSAGLDADDQSRLPGWDRIWLHVTVVAILLCVAPFLIFAWAEQFIASSLASIYNATTPLMTMLMAIAALPDERPTPRRLLGLGLGFGGVVVVLAPWAGRSGGSVAAQLGCLAATASYGAAFVYLRRYVAPRGLPALTVATMQVGVGGVIMMLLAPFIARDSVVLSARW